MKFSSQFRKCNFRVSPRRVMALIKEKHGSEQEEGSLTVFKERIFSPRETMSLTKTSTEISSDTSHIMNI